MYFSSFGEQNAQSNSDFIMFYRILQPKFLHRRFTSQGSPAVGAEEHVRSDGKLNVHASQCRLWDDFWTV